MKTLLKLLIIILYTSGCIAQPARHSFTIVAFGTSLTEGSQVEEERWTTMLRKMLRQRHPDIDITVINAGIGGSSTRDRLSHLQKDVLDSYPDLVIHDFAVNDANYKPERHVYLDEFAININAMHEQVVSKTGAAEIYWPQTPILSEKHIWWQQPLFVEAGGLDNYAEAYRKCTVKMSRKLHVLFVDMDTIFRNVIKKDGADKYILPDGIHYRKEGNRLIAESLLPLIEKVMKKKIK